MALKLPPLNAQVPIVDAQGRPTPQFVLLWQTLTTNIVTAFNGQQAALEAAGIALSAAEAADTAAAAAQTAADDAAAAATATAAATALANSSVTGLTLTATDAGASATIAISSHTRTYGDGTTAAVNAGSLTGLAYSTDYWVGYVDAPRTGGAVTYTASTTPKGNGSGDPAYHFVGAVTTPAAAGPPIDGLPVLPPGSVYP